MQVSALLNVICFLEVRGWWEEAVCIWQEVVAHIRCAANQVPKAVAEL